MAGKEHRSTRLAGATLLAVAGMISALEWNLDSPDGAISVAVKDGNSLQYTASLNGTTVIEWSPLGISLTDRMFVENPTFESEETSTVDETYHLPSGKCSTYRNYCNELSLDFKNQDDEPFRIVFRAYNDAVAYRYVLKGSGDVEITGESSGFTLPAGATGWVQKPHPAYEAAYDKGTVGSDFTSADLAFPALFETGAGAWVLVSEAAVYYPYCACHFSSSGGNSFTIKLADDQNITGSLPWETPWRVAIIGDSLGDIVESNVIEHLNPPCELDDVDWIKPGVSAWSWLTERVRDTEQQKEFIDMAAEMQWHYNLIDCDWPDKVNAEEAITYGKQKGIGNILWYHHNVHESGMDAEFERIKQWGAVGVKVDYFNSDRASMMKVYEDIAIAAARHELIVNYHGATVPRGQRRRWPHLLAWEAVAGDEYTFIGKFYPDAEHDCELPFTRNVVGPMDYTPKLTTDAHELALSVIFECGIPHFGNNADSYLNSPAKPFLTDFPAAWDETRFIDGYPGEYVCLARRTGSEWFVAGITGHAERTLTVPLSFLEEGSYSVSIYRNGAGKNEIAVETITLESPGEFTTTLPAEGGFCFRVPDSRGPTEYIHSRHHRHETTPAIAARATGAGLVVTGLHPAEEQTLVLTDLRGRLIARERVSGVSSYVLEAHTVAGGAVVVRVGKNRWNRTVMATVPK